MATGTPPDNVDPGAPSAQPRATKRFNIIHEGVSTDRSSFTPYDVITEIWTGLGLPRDALASVNLPGSDDAGPVLPSSYRIGCLAQSTIALCALSAALVRSVRTNGISSSSSLSLPRVTVPLRHATVEFQSVEHCSILPPSPSPSPAGPPPLLGLHPTASGGHIRIHSAFPHHRDGALRLLGLDPSSHSSLTRADVDRQTRRWDSKALESAGLAAGCAMYALRTYAEWDAHPASQAEPDFPIRIRRVDTPAPATSPSPSRSPPHPLRILDLTRVIAGPLASRALAAHLRPPLSDVLWLTAPHLPALPAVDRDLARGKRASAQLDLRREGDAARLRALVGGGDGDDATGGGGRGGCDVFVQGYRPGSLEARGWGVRDVVGMSSRGIVVGNVAAFSGGGEWGARRGFDSLVQTCSGMNASEAEHAGEKGGRPMPCQALDHATGYLLATGICAALYRRAVEGGGGSYCVDVSLAGTAKYLRSLGQYEGRSGFECEGIPADEVEGYMEVRESGLGMLKAVRHSASIEGYETGWDYMPKPLGSDEAEWQS
ncbi:carnitine dehydratase [Diplodia corticola]|uniref:Carnitine dehydratase n=1 Tax=Diplodia corticola TaxID=236234 RepID=A0A1J9QPM8_9PEZI|nr:carnitine dehydratase [Diplodia corticola]OJD29994.1 carnitine dehydratase [Diplodia corticola]